MKRTNNPQHTNEIWCRKLANLAIALIRRRITIQEFDDRYAELQKGGTNDNEREHAQRS